MAPVQDKLTFLPPQVEDFFRPPVMQQERHHGGLCMACRSPPHMPQVLMLLRNRRACALHGPEAQGEFKHDVAC